MRTFTEWLTTSESHNYVTEYEEILWSMDTDTRDGDIYNTDMSTQQNLEIRVWIPNFICLCTCLTKTIVLLKY